jgi:DNA-binding transcriptional MerR regulator
VTQQTVQGYAAKGQLHHIQASNGVRLFRPEAAAQVRKILKANLKRRGSFGRGISRS